MIPKYSVTTSIKPAINKHACACTALAVLLAIASTAIVSTAMASWPQWRGPSRDGKLQGKPWPASIAEDHLTETWRVSFGPSYSGPIVTEDRVFTTETKDRKTEVVTAVDRKTGNVLWQQKWEGAMRVPFFAAANGSWIRATPAFDGERLYVAGMRDVLVCLDAASGEVVWRVDFVEKMGTPVPSFGFASSPMVAGDHVYVQAGASFVKLDKLTGKIVWKAAQDKGGMFGSAFSSPILATLNDRPQLVVQTRQELKGIDRESGEELWSQPIKAFRGMNILTPTVYKNTVFTSAHSGESLLLRINQTDDATTVDRAWTNKAQAYMSSPIVINGHAYLHLKNQRFTCIDLETGKEKWRTTPFGKYWSMVANGNRLLALDERGDLLLIDANPEQYEQLDSRHISDATTWAHLAVSGDEVFVRSLDALIAYRWK